MNDFDRTLYTTVLEVVADWPFPAPGTDASAAPAFPGHWATAVRLGWTGVLDGADLAAEPDPDLIDSAVGAVEALGRAGVPLPVRQTLVARYAAGDRAPEESQGPDGILVHPTAYGVWAPSATGLDLAGRPCAAGAGGDPAEDDTPRTGELARLLLLAELLGAADGAIREARRYVEERVQFGRPLIRIPAVRTSLGEAAVAHRGMAAAVREAQRRFRVPAAVDGADRSLRFALTGARAVAAEAAGRIASVAHQLHGAMGITGEAGLHRRTTLLWAGRDEGLVGRDWGLAELPDAEEELWDLTAPAG